MDRAHQEPEVAALESRESSSTASPATVRREDAAPLVSPTVVLLVESSALLPPTIPPELPATALAEAHQEEEAEKKATNQSLNAVPLTPPDPSSLEESPKPVEAATSGPLTLSSSTGPFSLIETESEFSPDILSPLVVLTVPTTNEVFSPQPCTPPSSSELSAALRKRSRSRPRHESADGDVVDWSAEDPDDRQRVTAHPSWSGETEPPNSIPIELRAPAEAALAATSATKETELLQALASRRTSEHEGDGAGVTVSPKELAMNEENLSKNLEVPLSSTVAKAGPPPLYSRKTRRVRKRGTVIEEDHPIFTQHKDYRDQHRYFFAGAPLSSESQVLQSITEWNDSAPLIYAELLWKYAREETLALVLQRYAAVPSSQTAEILNRGRAEEVLPEAKEEDRHE